MIWVLLHPSTEGQVRIAEFITDGSDKSWIKPGQEAKTMGTCHSSPVTATEFLPVESQKVQVHLSSQFPLPHTHIPSAISLLVPMLILRLTDTQIPWDMANLLTQLRHVLRNGGEIWPFMALPGHMETAAPRPYPECQMHTSLLGWSWRIRNL